MEDLRSLRPWSGEEPGEYSGKETHGPGDNPNQDRNLKKRDVNCWLKGRF